MAVLPLSDDGRQYSLSPSISTESMSATGPATIGSDIQAYAQPYTIVQLPSGLRHSSIHKSLPESSEFRSSPSTMGPSFQSLNISQVNAAPQALGQRRPNDQLG
jgi:hypothetical protein